MCVCYCWCVRTGECVRVSGWHNQEVVVAAVVGEGGLKVGSGREKRQFSRASFVNEGWRRGRVCLRSTFQPSLITRRRTPGPHHHHHYYTPSNTPPTPPAPPARRTSSPQWHHRPVSLYIGWQGVSRAVGAGKHKVDQHRHFFPPTSWRHSDSVFFNMALWLIKIRKNGFLPK